MIHKEHDHTGWLLFFYSVPSQPVSNRMKLWRRLIKAGAVPFKGAGYILPFSEEHFELLQWLVSEVAAVKGDGAFVKVAAIETVADRDIIQLFQKQRLEDYRALEKEVEGFERRISSIRKGSSGPKDKKLLDQFGKYLKELEEIKKIDFFPSKAAKEMEKRLKTINEEIRKFSAVGEAATENKLHPKHAKNYQGKIWVTRKRPFVDRMASAWLIKRFIDKNALFTFIEEHELRHAGKEQVTFDLRKGEFTHVGTLCTFEVLMKSFGIKDKALKKIAEIVHELDIKDEAYHHPESKGIEEIAQGIRKTAQNDHDTLEKGMMVFEMLYASKT